VYLLPLSSFGIAPPTAFSTLGWLATVNAPSAPPAMAIISVGSALTMTWMLPPWMMYAPKMHPSATT